MPDQPPHNLNPPNEPIKLQYAIPRTIRPLSDSELKAWRIARRLTVIAAAISLGWWVASDSYLHIEQLWYAFMMLVLGTVVPLPPLSQANGRIRIPREIRTVISLISVISVIAAFVAIMMWLLGMFP